MRINLIQNLINCDINYDDSQSNTTPFILNSSEKLEEAIKCYIIMPVAKERKENKTLVFIMSQGLNNHLISTKTGMHTMYFNSPYRDAYTFLQTLVKNVGEVAKGLSLL